MIVPGRRGHDPALQRNKNSGKHFACRCNISLCRSSRAIILPCAAHRRTNCLFLRNRLILERAKSHILVHSLSSHFKPLQISPTQTPTPRPPLSFPQNENWKEMTRLLISPRSLHAISRQNQALPTPSPRYFLSMELIGVYWGNIGRI